MSATQTVTSADGTTIAYQTAGSGPALILVDAASCYRQMGPMEELAGHLTDQFTVTLYDRRGRGESTDTEPYAIEREVDDLAALIDAAGGSAYVHGFSSGGTLALHAAAAGLPIRGLALLEPPINTEPATGPSELTVQLSALIAEGRRADAVAHFQQSIGVPEEMVSAMRRSPGLEALAHTLVYDTIITNSMPMSRLAEIATPTLLLYSAGSDDRLQGWAVTAAGTLPHGEHRGLAGEWHGVPAKVLAPALIEYLTRDA
ncbi:MAG: alpha/beta fold hydrolase [Micromonosporaceae bacterium]